VTLGVRSYVAVFFVGLPIGGVVGDMLADVLRVVLVADNALVEISLL
jgi:hypothetical protein